MNHRRKAGPTALSGQRVVTLIRTNKGYGFTITNEQPCRLKKIVQGGPADLAGIHNMDRLLMLNGADVSLARHEDVASIIGQNKEQLFLGFSSAERSPSSSEDELIERRQSRRHGSTSRHHHTVSSLDGARPPLVPRAPTNLYNDYNAGTAKSAGVLGGVVLSDFPFDNAQAHTFITRESRILPPSSSSSSLRRPISYIAPTVDPYIASASSDPYIMPHSLDLRPPSPAPPINSRCCVNSKAVVGYVGTIGVPSIKSRHGLNSLRSAINHMRNDCRINSTVMMTVSEFGIRLSVAAGHLIAEYPVDKIIFCGQSHDDDHYFGIMTLYKENRPGRQGVHSVSSCHVFALESPAHAEHAQKAALFGIQCPKDRCPAFPASSVQIQNSILRICDNKLQFRPGPPPPDMYDMNCRRRCSTNSHDTSLASMQSFVIEDGPPPPQQPPQPQPQQQTPQQTPQQQRVNKQYTNAQETPPFVDHQRAPRFRKTSLAAPPILISRKFSEQMLVGQVQPPQTSYNNVNPATPVNPFVHPSLHKNHLNRSLQNVAPSMDELLQQRISSWKLFSGDKIPIDVSPIGQYHHHQYSPRTPLCANIKRPQSTPPCVGRNDDTECLAEPDYDSEPLTDKFDEHDLLDLDMIYEENAENLSFNANDSFYRAETKMKNVDMLSVGGGGGGNCSALMSNSAPDRAASWAANFDHLLADDLGIRTFTEFLKKEYSEENIQFWLQCEIYKKLMIQTERDEHAIHIYDQFLSEMASSSVNIDSVAMQQTKAALNEAEVHLFDLAQSQIYTLMKRDSYCRFLKSQLYRDVMVEALTTPLPATPSSSATAGSGQHHLLLRRGGASPVIDRRAVGGGGLIDVRFMKRSTKEHNESRRKSLLPWKRNKSIKHKNSRMSTELSELQTDIAEFTKTINKDRGNIKTSSKGQLCRVQLPGGATTVIRPQTNQTLLLALQKLCERRHLYIEQYDILDANTSTPVELRRSIVQGECIEVRLEKRSVCRIDLVANCGDLFDDLYGVHSFAFKANPRKTLADVLAPVLLKYGFKNLPYNVYKTNSAAQLSLDSRMVSVDNQRISVTFNSIAPKPMTSKPPKQSSDWLKTHRQLFHDITDGFPLEFNSLGIWDPHPGNTSTHRNQAAGFFGKIFGRDLTSAVNYEKPPSIAHRHRNPPIPRRDTTAEQAAKLPPYYHSESNSVSSDHKDLHANNTRFKDKKLMSSQSAVILSSLATSDSPAHNLSKASSIDISVSRYHSAI